jgi:hypothetical protein
MVSRIRGEWAEGAGQTRQVASVGTGRMLITRSRRNLPQRIIQRAAMRRALAAVLLTCGSVILAGCTVGSLGDRLPTAAGGLPENTPARPATPAAYPAVHDMPPARSDNVLTDEERKKLEADLIAARKRNEASNTGGAR